MNTLSTVGTLHDLFLSNPKYGLNEFASAVEQFKPDVIFTEARVNFPSATDACIDGGIEQAIVYAIAREIGIPVVATDWFNDLFIEEMIAEGSDLPPEIVNGLHTKMKEYQSLFFSADFETLHSPSCQNQISQIYAEYEKLGLLCSRKRNLEILSNIKSELAKFDGKRILVIYGMDHKYFLDTQLKNQVILSPTEDWYDPSKSAEFRFSKELKSRTIENLENAKHALSDRLQSTKVSKTFESRLRSKLPKFDIWIEHLNKK